MPIYEYECLDGHITEKFAVIAERNQSVHCKVCLKKTKRIFSKYSALNTRPKWINDSVRGALQDLSVPGTIPIKTRKQYNEHLKKNNLVCLG